MTMFASAEIKFYPRIYSRIPGFQLTGLAGLSCTVITKMIRRDSRSANRTSPALVFNPLMLASFLLIKILVHGKVMRSL